MLQMKYGVLGRRLSMYTQSVSEEEKSFKEDVHTSQNFHVFHATGVSNVLCCVLLPLLKRLFSLSQIQLECE